MRELPEPKLLLVTETKTVHQFPFTDAGATAAVEELERSGGQLYQLNYRWHHKGTADEEVLPRATRIDG